MAKSLYKICSKCGNEFHSCAVRKCPHPAVNRVYGENICHSCCLKCKHNKIEDIGQACTYKAEI